MSKSELIEALKDAAVLTCQCSMKEILGGHVHNCPYLKFQVVIEKAEESDE